MNVCMLCGIIYIAVRLEGMAVLDCEFYNLNTSQLHIINIQNGGQNPSETENP